jgi:hypothetical protein
MSSDRTLNFENGKEFIWVYLDSKRGKPVKVFRKRLAHRNKCEHKWTAVANKGHGGWRSGCSRCGALCR